MLITLLMLFQTGPAPPEDQCVKCHSELVGTPLGDPVETRETDVHAQLGLSCAACHGGDPTSDDMEKAKSRSKGYIGRPEHSKIAEVCGSCHSSADSMQPFNPKAPLNQLTDFLTSRHGILSAQGNEKAATCTSCHSVHDIRRVDDPTSPVYPLNVATTCGGCHSDRERIGADIPVNQADLYRSSVHARHLYDQHDLFAPTCNDCHGNHGATVPGASSPAGACATCHVIQGQLFEQSPHAEAFDLIGFEGCITCHGNHEVAKADESLLFGESAACNSCHEGDAGEAASKQMGGEITKLRQRMAEAHEILSRAARAGMEVSGPIFDLSQAGEKLIVARTDVHLLDLDKVSSSVEEGMKIADASFGDGEKALEDLRFRRQGLYVALAIILAVVVSLVLWIRFIEQEQTADQS